MESKITKKEIEYARRDERTFLEFICYYKNRKWKERKAKVLLLLDKKTNKYAFVNVSKGHVCECRFNTQNEAMNDLKMRCEDPKNDLYKFKFKIKASISWK